MSKYVGQSIKRKEDYRLVTGTGKFVADIQLNDMAEVVFLRSPHAHAKISNIDVLEAVAIPGVYGVFSAKDFEGKIKPLSQFESHCALPSNLIHDINPVIHYNYEDVLAINKVMYVGQPVVVVVAENRYIAEDAAALIKVSYEPLRPVVDPFDSMSDAAPLVQEHMVNNVQSHFQLLRGDFEQVASGAEHVIKTRISTPRLGSNPLETRGVIAQYDGRSDQMHVHSSTQMPYEVRLSISECIDFPEEKIRVTAPDVGGGFGPKGGVHPEEIIVPYLAKLLNKSVRWIEDRLEHLTSSRQSRDQIHDVEVAFQQDGTILGLKDDFVIDSGAVNYFALTCAYNSAYHLRGMYKIPIYQSNCKIVLTNKAPNVPFRGAGRPEVAFVMDRIVDMIARKLKIDPVEVMKKNMIAVEDMPYNQGIFVKDGAPLIYDSGNYPEMLQQGLEMVDYENFRVQQEELKKRGKYVGIGISSYVEGTGAGPFEGAHVSLDLSGHVVAHLGSSPQGQGHETVFAQVCADAIGTSPDQITVIVGDTNTLQYGAGTYASRSAVNGGSAIYEAGLKLKDKILSVAEILLEVSKKELKAEDGKVFRVGELEKFLTFKDIARASRPGKVGKLPKEMEPGLQITHYFVPPTVTFAASIHIALVEVDKETGFVEIKNYSVVHDCGTVLNPMIVDGQIQGGIAQGIGSALYEEVVYDKNGQLLTGTYMDYLLPTAMEIPTVEKSHQEYLSTRNPLGIKGVGEGGAISPPAAIANAIVDALTPLDICITELPVTPSRLRKLIMKAESERQVARVNE